MNRRAFIATLAGVAIAPRLAAASGLPSSEPQLWLGTHILVSIGWTMSPCSEGTTLDFTLNDRRYRCRWVQELPDGHEFVVEQIVWTNPRFKRAAVGSTIRI
jgi:hypothetical protein